MRAPRVVSLVAAVAAAAGLIGCGPDRRQIRSEVVGERWQDAESDLNQRYGRHLAELGHDSPEDGPSKQALLWRMERGTVDFLQHEWGRSLDHFRAAARAGQDLRTVGATRVAASYLLNDTVRTYTGEPFEHAYVRYYGALANLFCAETRDGSWVPPEVAGPPPAAPPPQTPATWYDRAASASIALEDGLRALSEQEWGESNFRDDAFLHAVAAIVRAQSASSSDDRQAAAMYAQRAWKAYGNTAPAPLRVVLPRIAALGDRDAAQAMGGWAPPPDGYGTVVVIEELGFVPKREAMRVWAVSGAPPGAGYFDLGGVFVWTSGPYEADFRRDFVPVPAPAGLVRQLSGGAVGVFGFALPILPLRLARPSPGRLAGPPAAFEVVDDVRDHARVCFDDHKAKRVVTTLVRTATKLIATRVAIGAGVGAARRHDDIITQLLKDVFWFAGSAAVTATEQADTRCWTLLPDSIAATTLDVPAGEHRLALTRADGATVSLGTVRVRAGRIVVVHRRDYPSTPDLLGPED